MEHTQFDFKHSIYLDTFHKLNGFVDDKLNFNELRSNNLNETLKPKTRIQANFFPDFPNFVVGHESHEFDHSIIPRFFGIPLHRFKDDNAHGQIKNIVRTLKQHHKALRFAHSCNNSNLAHLASDYQIQLRFLEAIFPELMNVSENVAFDISNLWLCEISSLWKTASLNEETPLYLFGINIQLRRLSSFIIMTLFKRNNHLDQLLESSDDQNKRFLIEVFKFIPEILNFIFSPYSGPQYQLKNLEESKVGYLIYLVQELARFYMEFDVSGKTFWNLISDLLFPTSAKDNDSISKSQLNTNLANSMSELKWSIILFIAKINSKDLTNDASFAQRKSNPCWNIVQKMLEAEFFEPIDSQEANNRSSTFKNSIISISPTKALSGPKNGIADILSRISYLSALWDTVPFEVIFALSKFFCDRISTINFSVSLLDNQELILSQNVFDKFIVFCGNLFVHHQIKNRDFSLSKLCAFFASILEKLRDKPASNDLSNHSLDSGSDQALIRNVMQFLIHMADKMTDSQFSLLFPKIEESIPWNRLGPNSQMIVFDAFLRLLSIISRRKQETEEMDIFVDEELLIDLSKERANISGDLKIMFSKLMNTYLALVENPSARTSPIVAQQQFLSRLDGSSAFKKSKTDMKAVQPQEEYESAIIFILTKLEHLFGFVQKPNSKIRFSKHFFNILSDNQQFLNIISNLKTSLNIRHKANDLIRSFAVANLALNMKSCTPETNNFFSVLLDTYVTKVLNNKNCPLKVIDISANSVGSILAVLIEAEKVALNNFVENDLVCQQKDAVSRSIPNLCLRYLISSLISSLQKGYSQYSMSNETLLGIFGTVFNSMLERNLFGQFDLLTQIKELVNYKQKISGTQIDVLQIFANQYTFGDLENWRQFSQPTQTFVHICTKLCISIKMSISKEILNSTLQYQMKNIFKNLADTAIKIRSEIISNPKESTSNSTPLLEAYDQQIYPIIGSIFTHLSSIVYNKSDGSSTLFSRLVHDFFLKPLADLSTVSEPIKSTPSSSNPFFKTTTLKNQQGLVIGTNSAKKTSLPPTSPVSSPQQSTKILVRNGCIAHVNELIFGLSQLEFENDSFLQRIFLDVIIRIFNAFISGLNHETKLIEQFSTSLVHYENADQSIIEKSEFEKVSKLRNFFLSNVVPWIIMISLPTDQNPLSSQHQANMANSDTIFVILARFLSWIFIRLKKVPTTLISSKNMFNNYVESYLLVSNYIVDCIRSKKPTKSSFVKLELYNFISRFLAGLFDVFPLVSSNSSIEHGFYKIGELLVDGSEFESQNRANCSFLKSAIKETIAAIIDDLGYITSGSWTNHSPSGDMNTSIRVNLINQNFVDKFVTDKQSWPLLSISSITPPSQPSTLLINLIEVMFSILDHIKRIGGSSILTDFMPKLKSTIFESNPSPANANRQKRPDIIAGVSKIQDKFLVLEAGL